VDEKSGMNFSEYMALLSGNTDLLDKAKLENTERKRFQSSVMASMKAVLLRNSPVFDSNLNSESRGAMGARTIDEGAVDEKSGMNFSEYMALLSGNTDLLLLRNSPVFDSNLNSESRLPLLNDLRSPSSEAMRLGGSGREIGHELFGIYGVAIRQHRPAGQGET